nr:type 2 lanthipeptide synthetase LanM [Propionicimonas sp.]
MPAPAHAFARSLFPEIEGRHELDELLLSVSGATIEEINIAPGLAALDGVTTRASRSELTRQTSLDAFARSIADEQRQTLLKTFLQHPASAAHAKSLADQAVHDLASSIHQLSVRTLVASMHYLRDRSELTGRTSSERFQCFCTLSSTPEFAESLARGFPVHATQVRQAAQQAHLNIAEFLIRLEETFRSAPLAALVAPQSVLTRLQMTSGDPHARGRRVLIAHFDSGTKLVYKPRPMAAEAALSQLLKRLNEAAGTHLAVLTTIDLGDYGWQEYADGNTPTDRDVYFTSCGQLLGALHLLRASDMHYENVATHRGLPVAIDAETLFCVNERRSASGEQPSAVSLALANSVYSTGFLPTRVDDDHTQQASIDIGFLGYEPDQGAITAVPVLIDDGTDLARVDLAYGTIQDAPTRPIQPSRSADELAAISGGYTQVCHWVMGHRDMVEGWLSELFGGVRIRAVVHNTRSYTQLINLATHPRFQESLDLTRILFHRCAIGRLDHVTPNVVRCEVSDLCHRDVPYFSLRTDDTAVYDWQGNRLADVLRRPPLENVLSALRGMTEMTLGLNLKVIRGSYVDKIALEQDRPRWDQVTAHSGRSADIRSAVCQVARNIADDLVRSAIRDGDDVATQWIGPTVVDTSRPNPWRFRELGNDLYAGAPGLSLFLAAAGALTGDETYVETACSHLLPSARALLTDQQLRCDTWQGGLAGSFAGVAYALVEAGEIAGREDCLASGLRLWTYVPEMLADLEAIDCLTGSAGLLTVANGLLSAYGSETRWGAELAHVQRACREHLHAGVHHLLDGDHAVLYSGYAHGLQGMIGALGSDPDPTSAQLSDELAELYERSFGRDRGAGWAISSATPDYRAHGWCHGSPGILLGETGRFLRGDGSRASEVDLLIDVVSNDCFDLNFSLCHGDLGNLLILRRAARARARQDVLSAVQLRVAQLSSDILPPRLAKPVGKTFQNDSLMIGLAGIGYGLIALSGAVTVPDLLTFEVLR